MYNPDESQMTDREKALNELFYQIGKEGLEYVDNIRVALANDTIEFKEYDKKASQGCCGSFDTTVIINGDVYMIGCNHGH